MAASKDENSDCRTTLSGVTANEGKQGSYSELEEDAGVSYMQDWRYVLPVLTAVRKIQEYNGRTENGIESARRSEVDGAEGDRDQRGYNESYQRDIQPLDDLSERSGSWQATISCECPCHATRCGNGTSAGEELAADAKNLQAGLVRSYQYRNREPCATVPHDLLRRLYSMLPDSKLLRERHSGK